jgi:hypothetical protein
MVVQGFLFSRPLSETDLLGMLTQLTLRSRQLLAPRSNAIREEVTHHRGRVVPLSARNHATTPSPSASLGTPIPFPPPLNPRPGAVE